MLLTPRSERPAAVATALSAALIVVVAGCFPSSARPMPTESANLSGPPRASGTPAVPGLTWVKAASVARPEDAFAGASAAPTAPSGPGTAGHPGHFPGQAIVDDVARVGNRLVAVGTSACAVPGPRSHGRRMPGCRRNGTEWERIVTVLATDASFLAGGSAGPELGDRQARFWHSADGVAWSAVPDDPVFGGAEVVSIVARAGGFVALGRLGTGQRGTGSIAWVSADGVEWQRVDSPALASGLAVALTSAPDGSLVAVGSDLDEREALAWRSADGSAWELAPAEESRLYHGAKIRMTDVVSLGSDGFLAVGNHVDMQYGTATSWVSTDGLAWRRAPRYPALEQGEMLAITDGPDGLVAVGSFGAPDNYTPTVWHGPPVGG